VGQYAYASRLSEHIGETPEGYLICTACVLCRSGYQNYLRAELELSGRGDDKLSVYRPPEEVLDPTFIATLPGKALTLNHPSSGFLNAMNHNWSAKGTVLNARRGPDIEGEVTLVGDIIITDPDTIERVKAGLRQLSVGYTFELVEGPHGPTMTTYRANHLAIVPSGRAGNARILDSGEMLFPEDGGVTFTEDNDEDTLDEDTFPMAKTRDEDSGQVQRLCTLLEKLLSKLSGSSSTADDTQPEMIPVAELAESERGENPVVDDLRTLKPLIQASGDRKAIDAFNAAMRAAKRGNTGPGEQLIAVYDRQPERFESYEETIRRRRRELLSGQLNPEPAAAWRRAEDRRSGTETYQEMIDRTRRQMLSAK
jgi:hypothetical protein